MSGHPPIQDGFLRKVTTIIQQHLSDERFGVSELAREVGMSRSNLLRTIKKKSGVSVSQFIRQLRLKEGMDILKQSDMTVSEVSYEVGFGSTSYFIKCFREYYGYPPGEVIKGLTGETESGQEDISGNNQETMEDAGKKDVAAESKPSVTRKTKNKSLRIGIPVFAIAAGTIIFLLAINTLGRDKQLMEKSIAVLPFINDSDDSTNVHIINGLMESILNSLQQIEDLRVISRTSVEKYRDNPSTIPEMARELNVNYFVEGSGQKIGDQIFLHIQLIEAHSDKHLLSEQYNRQAEDIFNLQVAVAKDIAEKIQAAITPEEEERISKVPTQDTLAYDYFLKGLDLLKPGYPAFLEKARSYFDSAIVQDPVFARAYAAAALTCYFLDLYQPVNIYTIEIGQYADQSLLLDDQLPQALVAKALFHMNDGQYEQAVPYLEEALEYNPNYDLAFVFLTDLYVNYIPDTKKYLEYALRGMQLDVSAYDSLTKSLMYLHAGNAFIQSGFIDEAETFITRSLAYNPDNLYAAYVQPYILFARNADLQQTREQLQKILEKAPNMVDLLMETGKICYFMKDYESAYGYFKRFMTINDSLNLHAYRGEYAKIGLVLSEMGETRESERYFSEYLEYAENDHTIYRHLSLSVYNAHIGNTEKALEELELFAQQSNYHYWIILFMPLDPLLDPVRDLPEFKSIYEQIESKFWDYHEEIKASLEEKGLI